MKAEPQIWTSASTCFLFFTLPLVTGPLAVLGHTLAIYMELLLRSWSLAKHSIILASTKTLIHGLHVLIGTHIHECNTGVQGDQDHFLCKEMLISRSILKLHKNP